MKWKQELTRGEQMLLAETVSLESFGKDSVLHKRAASEQCELHWPSASVFSNALSVEVKYLKEKLHSLIKNMVP